MVPQESIGCTCDPTFGLQTQQECVVALHRIDMRQVIQPSVRNGECVMKIGDVCRRLGQMMIS